MSLLLTREQSESRACVAVRVVDGVGTPAEEQPELCFDPIEGSHFEACSSRATIGASHTGPHGRGTLVFCAGLLGLVAARRRED